MTKSKLSFGAAGLIVLLASILIAADVERPARVVTKNKVATGSRAKSDPTAIRRAQLESFNEEYKTALRIWHVGHDPKTAAALFKGMVARHEIVPLATARLAEIYVEMGDDAQALQWFRAIYVLPHTWRSSDEGNLWMLGAYVDAARRLGQSRDVAAGERLILQNYHPAGDSPPLTWDPSSPKSVHAYACAARALYRGENFNGVDMALEAVSADPDDAVIRWIAGTVLFDAGKTRESVEQYRAAIRLGGLDDHQTNVMNMHLRQASALH